MTVAIAGRAPATFEIKSANLPLVALLLKSADLQTLSQELASRFGDIPDFFDNEPMVIDLTPLKGDAAQPLDFPALITLLRQYRVLPIAVRGAADAQLSAALAAGLVAAPDLILPRTVPAKPEEPAPAIEPKPEPRTEVPVIPAALVIHKPIRSGQQVYARGRDLIVTAMVNPGAEVIADGNIHVYAPLRGKAMAGARGNTQARIFSLSLEPELLSIAGIYRTSENDLPPTVRARPAQAWLEGPEGQEKMLIEAFKP